jgi:hypothetical protein
LRSETTTLFDIHVAADPHLEATWLRPDHFSFTSSQVSEIAGPVVRFDAVAIREEDDRLVMTFRRPMSTDETHIAILERADGTFALSFPELPFEPWSLTRENGEPNMGNWQAGATYSLPRHFPSNAEIKALFDADQAVRTKEPIDWTKLSVEDAARKTRTRELLNSGALRSGSDFYYAAFIFQHGNDPNDYLLAHALAMAATARGYDASWISAASLDRYLHTLGKPQIFGTQYQCDNKTSTQGSYQTEMLTDEVRLAVGVPKLAEQKAQGQRICG